MKPLPDEVERAFKALLDAVGCEQDRPEVGFAAALRLVRAGAREDRSPASSTRENIWRIAIDAWDDGFDWSVIPFIAGLRDANGEKLPFEVTLFLVDLALREGKTKIKPHILAKTHIKKMYPILLKAEQKRDRSQRGELSASEKVKHDMVEMFGVSYAVIDQIVSPRPSRQSRKDGPDQPD
mgnify:CR=1 FL=1